MSEFNLKIIAKDLGKDIENIAESVENELQAAVSNLANATHASIMQQIQSMSMDPKNRQEYLKSLKIDKLGDSEWLIYLDSPWAIELEQGFSPYSLKDKLLSSKSTVSQGPRAGQPWVRTAEDGTRYASVPFNHKPYSGESKSANMGDMIKKMTAKNMAGQEQKLTKVFKDLGDKPISGKVASIKSAKNPFLSGLTKYQHVSDSGKVSSVYTTFRVVSDKSSGWQHPGFGGFLLFTEAEKYVEQELENIINTLL